MLNKATLIGRLGGDPETKALANDQGTVVHFSLATSEKWNDKAGERQERTEWHNLVAWGKLGDICVQYLKKGDLIYVEGRIQTYDYEDRERNPRQKTEIVIHEMKMLGGRKSQEEPAPVETPPEPAPAATPAESEKKARPAKKTSRRKTVA